MQTTTQPTFQSGETITALLVNPANSTSKNVYTLLEKEDGWYIHQPTWSTLEHISTLSDALIFRGSSIPYKIDAEYSDYASNSSINIVSKDEPQTIKDWIINNNLNPKFTAWETIKLRTSRGLDAQYTRLFN